MAIIVDKEQKRKDIALSCVQLFVKGGIKDLTISEVAAQAGIGKGTFYDYYKNKDALVFEILTIVLQEHSMEKEKKLENLSSTRDKVKIFFDFFYNENDKELRQIYREYLSISLGSPNEEMMNFQNECTNTFDVWIQDILQEAVQKKEIIPESINLAKSFLYFADGAFINHNTTHNINDLEKEINLYVDTIFNLIEVKK